MRADDFSLAVDERQSVAEQADRLLRESKLYDCFPTPVEQLVGHAKLSISYLEELVPHPDAAPDTVKKALSKLQGLLVRADRKVFVSKQMNTAARRFVALHEVAHEWLPEQKMIYEILEDSDEELDEDSRDLFERCANSFASDVLFQLDRFDKLAAGEPFGIGAPVKRLSKQFRAGIYSTLRRYVEAVPAPVALLVCDRPSIEGALPIRRFLSSQRFVEAYGRFNWPDVLGYNSWFAMNRPLKQFMLPIPWRPLLNGKAMANEMFLVEAYDSSRQIFFLLYPMNLSFAGSSRVWSRSSTR